MCHVTESCEAFSSANIGVGHSGAQIPDLKRLVLAPFVRPSPPPFPFGAICARATRSAKDSLIVDYVSTRGAAPTLGFADALLAGLARDGGLYVPLSVPHLPPDAIRALRGVPYPEAAARIMAPFVERGFRFRRNEVADRGRLCRLPSRRDCAAHADRRQPVRARTFPRTDAGVQGFRHAVAGPGDESRFAAARRAGDDHWSDLGRHRRCGDRGFRRAVPGRSVHPLSAGPGVGRAAPADDDGRSAERPRARD